MAHPGMDTKLLMRSLKKNVERTTFTFTAKIYKAEGVTINSGEFSASALINIVYL